MGALNEWKNSRSKGRNEKTAYTTQDEKQARARIAQLDQIMTKLYEDSALSMIAQEGFSLMFKKYDEEQAERVREQQGELAGKTRQFARLMKKMTDIVALTLYILSKLIKRIVGG